MPDTMTEGYVEMDTETAVPNDEGNKKESATGAHSYEPTRGFFRQSRAFIAMAIPYFREESYAQWLLVVIVLLTLLSSGVRVVFSYLARDFWSALSEQRQEDFFLTLQLFLGSMILLAPIHVLHRYQRQQLAIHWRQWMTTKVLNLYFSNRVYYGLEQKLPTSLDVTGATTTTTSNLPMDNPDQRITEDVHAFTGFSLSLMVTVLSAIVDLVCFSIILFTILPQLFLAILAFSSFGTLMVFVLGSPLVQLNFEKLQKEAYFRFSLVRVRESAEEIAFLQGEPVEQFTIGSKFSSVIENMKALNLAIRRLEFFTTYYDYLTWILPIVVVAPQYFAGAVELGVVQQSASAFSHVLSDLSILIDQWETLAQFSAGIDRLYSFLNVAQDLAVEGADPDDRVESSPLLILRREKSSPQTAFKTNCGKANWQQSPSPPFFDKNVKYPGIKLQRSPDHDAALSIQNLTINIPRNNNNNNRYYQPRALLHQLNITVPWGEHLLICGSSGCGKSGLIRAIAGLWKDGTGVIYRPNDADVIFLPQKPYCPMGSLREQLVYPSKQSKYCEEEMMSDQELLAIFRSVDLDELPARVGGGDSLRGLDTVMDWSHTLSLGEQQRLAFGRILVHRPMLILLDESTSALPITSEKKLYNMLQNISPKERPNGKITCISVGHRPSLEEFHNKKITLQGENAGGLHSGVSIVR